MKHVPALETSARREPCGVLPASGNRHKARPEAACRAAITSRRPPKRREGACVAKMAFRLPPAASVHENPSPAEVKELTARMPTARPTQYGNLNVQTEVLARSKRSTFIVTDEPDGQNQSLTREEGQKWAD